jgi:hypothetical protein
VSFIFSVTIAVEVPMITLHPPLLFTIRSRPRVLFMALVDIIPINHRCYPHRHNKWMYSKLRVAFGTVTLEPFVCKRPEYILPILSKFARSTQMKNIRQSTTIVLRVKQVVQTDNEPTLATPNLSLSNTIN